MQSLKTARLLLRPFSGEDASQLAASLDDIEVTRWLTPVPHPYSLAFAQQHIEHVLASNENTLVLDLKGKLVGSITIGSLLGFWLDRSVWRRGLMTEAVKAMITNHFANGAADLKPGYHMGNAGSARIHKNIGFKPTRIISVFARALGRKVDQQNVTLSRLDWEALA